MVRGYISRYEHNTHEPPNEQLAIAGVKYQVLLKEKLVFEIKGDISGSVTSILILKIL